MDAAVAHLIYFRSMTLYPTSVHMPWSNRRYQQKVQENGGGRRTIEQEATN